MRNDRMLPVGLLVMAGIGVSCGDVATGTTETSSALAARKANPFEAKVRERKLLSDPGLMAPARKTDPTLVNGWGIAFDPKTGLAWISSNGPGTAEVVDEDGNVKKSVMLPDGSAPTGDVFNPTHSFKGDDFIFATENGTIIGVKRNETAADSDNPRYPGPVGSNFKGLTIAKVHGKDRLLIADFGDEIPGGGQSFGAVVVLDDDYKLVSNDTFIDPGLPSGVTGPYSPFNVMAVGDLVFVTFAQHSEDDFHDDAKGDGLGLVDLFTTDGRFITQLVKNGTGSVLNSPWAMALKRDSDDRKGPDLFVGNFGNGMINVFDLSLSARNPSATFDGTIANPFGQPLVIDGLWGFAFGNGRGDFDPDDLYFCAGPNDEGDGLFGELDFVGRR